MDEKSLRSAVIRLASAKPELRPHLLPILAKTASVDEMSLAKLINEACKKVKGHTYRAYHTSDHGDVFEAVIITNDIGSWDTGDKGWTQSNGKDTLLLDDALDQKLTDQLQEAWLAEDEDLTDENGEIDTDHGSDTDYGEPDLDSMTKKIGPGDAAKFIVNGSNPDRVYNGLKKFVEENKNFSPYNK